MTARSPRNRRGLHRTMPQRQQGSGRAAFPVGAPVGATQSLQPPWGRATGWRPTPPSSMAFSKAPRCEIRCLVMHIYPDGIKAYGHERITQSISRRSKPIKKLRYVPMATSASPSPSAAAASRSRSSAICPWPAPMPSPASCKAALAPQCR